MKQYHSSLTEVFSICLKIIDEQSFYDWTSPDQSRRQRQSVMCRIYEALIDTDYGCNALGNNLNCCMEDVKAFLASYSKTDSIERDCRDYILRLYLIVERVYEVLNVIGLRDEKHRMSTDGLRSLRDVKQWANFIKHPGAFLWCHMPQYWCASLEPPNLAGTAFVIDQKIVNEFYKDDSKKHSELHEKLSNTRNVHVVFPDLVILTTRFCSGLGDFCATVSGPMFKDVLKKKSTIDDYFATA